MSIPENETNIEPNDESLVNEPVVSASASEPPKKRFPVLIVVALCIVLLLLGGAAGGVLYLRWARKPYATSGKPVRLTVPDGASAATVAADLERQHVIRSARVFTMTAKGRQIHPGIYDISPTESVAKILSRLEKGDVVRIRVTFPEGFTVRQMAKRLERNGLCKEAEFYDLVTQHGDTLNVSFKPPTNLEGYLFPDTYRFPLGDSATMIATRMLNNFDGLVTTKKADEIKKSGRSLHDIITVAAMVEREAEVDKDRPMIAGVIYNRLRINMPLQIDATVQYARGEHKTRLLYSDLKIDSPYNTYRHRGLPPGPICCPGLPSIEAALNPAKHDYLFYVAQPDGSHVFSRTMAEHSANISRIRRRAR